MAAKKTVKQEKMMGMYACCMSSCGIVHVIGGVGLAFLLVEYFHLADLMIWGWVLLAISVLGHLMGKTHCSMK